MTKSDLVTKLTEANPHLTRADCRIVVATIFGEIVAALCRGDRVEVRGFGTFSVKRQNAHARRHPLSGASVQVSEKQVPRFKAGRLMGRRLNE